MDWLQALLMGIFQGLTEYLPVSSSGHLAIAGELLGVEDPDKVMSFAVAVHVATVLSTIVILWKEIVWIFKGLFRPLEGGKMNAEQKYTLNILVSMIPIGVVGVLFKDEIEQAFGGLVVVGCCLLVTAALLSFSYFAKPRTKEHISLKDAFIIGIAQAIAALPGLSRSGSTIGTGLILGDKKESLAQFDMEAIQNQVTHLQTLDVLKDIKDAMQTAVNNFDYDGMNEQVEVLEQLIVK